MGVWVRVEVRFVWRALVNEALAVISSATLNKRSPAIEKVPMIRMRINQCEDLDRAVTLDYQVAEEVRVKLCK